MKNLFTRLMLVAVAAMGIVACQTEPVIYVPEVNTFDMTIIADGDTRTELVNGTSINWSAGDQLSVVVNNSTKTSSALESATTTASFNVEGVATSGSYTIQAVYPADANKGASDTNPNVYKIATATEQTPSTTSFDGAADMLVAKEVTTTKQPSELNMQFTRLVALGEMTLTMFTPESAIKSVTFSTSDTALTGRSYVNLSTTEVEYGYTNQAFKKVVLSYNGDEVWGDAYKIYFTCFPAELTTDFTVVVETTDGTEYTKTVTLDGKTLSFTAGDMTRFKVKMDDAEVKEPSALTTYNLLTDIGELNAGDKIIIAAAGYDYALSTTQNSNNRGAVAITKSKTTVTFGDDVQILTLEAGTVDGTFALNTGSGYLYTASSNSNHLKTKTTLDANGSWSVTADSNGVASLTANGSNTRNLLKFNNSNSPKIFSCYSSGQDDVAIYYLDGEYLTVSTDTISFTAEGGEETFTVSKNFEAEVSVTCDNLLFTITPGDNDGSYTVTAPTNETTKEITGTITVTAGDFTRTIAVTQKAVPVEAEEITIAEFIKKADTTTEYKLTGTISNVVNTTYGNFDLTDASGKIFVYGLHGPEGEDKYWSTAGVKAGDVITIQGTYELYNNTTNEVVNAKYVSHYGVTAEKTSVSLAAGGSSESVKLTLINTTEAISVEHNEVFTVELNDKTLTISGGANETGAALTDTISVKVGEAYTEIIVSQAAKPTGGDTTTSWHSESWSSATAHVNTYTNGTIVGDLGTWTYDGCSTYDDSQFNNKHSLALGKTADATSYSKPTIVSPTFNNGINGIKFNYYANSTARKVTVKVYVNGVESSSHTVQCATTYTLTSAEINVATSGATYIEFIGDGARRFSIGDIEINY